MKIVYVLRDVRVMRVHVQVNQTASSGKYNLRFIYRLTTNNLLINEDTMSLMTVGPSWM